MYTRWQGVQIIVEKEASPMGKEPVIEAQSTGTRGIR